jgi:hypothetical protein
MNDNLEKSRQLLNRIKENLSEIENLYRRFAAFEEDYVYRFYHQSFKVFMAQEEIKTALELFDSLAPEGVSLNDWYWQIADKALNKTFDQKRTNAKWTTETRPILEAFWHSQFFLEQMLRYGREIDENPQILPEGWAAVLYLYNLR